MGIWKAIHKLIMKQVSATEISPHSWDEHSYQKGPLSEERLKTIIPLLKTYYGEENFEDFFKTHSRDAIKIEQKINFLVNDGKPLARDISLLLSFDLARVCEKLPLAHLDDLKTIIVYPVGLPVEDEAAGYMISNGPKQLMDQLGSIAATLELIHWIYQELPNKSLFLEMEKERTTLMYEFNHWKKEMARGLNLETKEQIDLFLPKLQTFFKKYCTQNIIDEYQDSASGEFNAIVQNALQDASLIHTHMDQFVELFKNCSAYDEHSIHLSWVYHLSYLMDTERNLFIHELAHYIDAKNGITVFDLEDQIWDDLHSTYSESNNLWMGDYATTNRKEFFAVASEVFFRKAEIIKQNDKRLFSALKKIYKKVPKARDRASYSQLVTLAGQNQYEDVDKNEAA